MDNNALISLKNIGITLKCINLENLTWLITMHSIKQFIPAQELFFFSITNPLHDQGKWNTWHPTMLATLNLCPKGLMLRICSGCHSNCRIHAMMLWLLCGKFVAERILKDSIGSHGAAMLQLFLVWHLDKEHLIGVNFIQSKDNHRASLSIEQNILIKMCDKKFRAFNL